MDGRCKEHVVSRQDLERREGEKLSAHLVRIQIIRPAK